jgi:NAD(P)-dependent dehydrogenase (short-subunit alcohol dehydrogenase family)/acyl dehydratase
VTADVDPTGAPRRDVWEHRVEEQAAFAALSGDANPLHVDPVAARRLPFGAAVVHGINLVLRDLDLGLAAPGTGAGPVRATRLVARFRRPVAAGTTVTYVRTTQPTGWSTVVEEDGRLRAELVVELAPAGDEPSVDLGPAPTGPCVELPIDDIAAAHGTLPLHLDGGALAARFPALAARLAPIQVAQLLATTRLVGMQCPGLHSVYRELALELGPPVGRPELRWQVVRYDPRFGLVRITADGAGIAGTVQAAVRAQPAEQASMAAVRARVDPSEFADQRAVVVGGSRGLGELVARILAAGGAAVTVTYRVGRDDADRVVATLGPRGAVRQLDVTADPDDVAAALGGLDATHLYYFATPPIPTGEPGRFDQRAFAAMAEVYVVGLWAVVGALARDGALVVFNPSSVYVERPPRGLAEYAAAKAAAEGACRALETEHPAVRTRSPRLPPMATDQTAGVAALGPDEALAVVLDAVRDAVRD